ncbi:hypothetical protein GCM10025862_10340 [Arsenicicoccus piscis]|uniref:Ribosomal RNA methyltransferase FtsJ domain-containing protein n=1 Tax=Arsenicicoccus piscis TaxID=673954 RepID=A0ABQ6HMW1_9MICO|nr:hypothetical protein GCM10025862_10340 [Arsenicicoccus piscis]
MAEVADDPRVDERSGVNVRYVEPDELGGPFQLLVSDLSFISLTLVLDRLRALTLPGADLVLLVKPQFEVGRDRLGRTGVVRSTEQRVEAVVRVAAEAERMGLTVHGLARSPIAGGDGNVEVLLWCRHPSADPPPRPGLSVDAARVEPLVVDRAGGPPRPSKETLS